MFSNVKRRHIEDGGRSLVTDNELTVNGIPSFKEAVSAVSGRMRAMSQTQADSSL